MVYGSNPQTPRQRRRRDNLQRLLDTAMAIIVDSGFGGLSMARLADAADYTPGALYRYFRNKDAIVSALVTQVISDAGATLALRAAPDEAAPPSAHLRHLIGLATDWLKLSQDQPHRFALVSMMLASPQLVLEHPDDVRPAFAAVQRVLAPVVGALSAAETSGAVSSGNAVDRAILLFAGAQGVLQLGKTAAHAPALIDVPRLYEAMVASLLAGWGAPADTLQDAIATESRS